ncbi:ABC transporter permease, partial [Streptomyces tricolor]
MGRRREPVAPPVAPWVRTRLRAAPGAAAALALLVALTACLAGAYPRAVDRYEDAGLRRALRQARPEHTTVRLSAPQPDLGLPPGRRAAALRPAALERQYTKVLGTIGEPLAVDRAQSAYGVAGTVTPAVPDPWLPRPTGLPARGSLSAQSGLAAHARGRARRAPAAAPPRGGPGGPPAPPGARRAPAGGRGRPPGGPAGARAGGPPRGRAPAAAELLDGMERAGAPADLMEHLHGP